ncbi:MAG: hypothetical protein ACP5JH_04995 [Bacteroidota bacterium]
MKTTKFYRGLVATLALAVVISYADILIPTFTPKSVAAYENPTKALCVVSKPGGRGERVHILPKWNGVRGLRK